VKGMTLDETDWIWKPLIEKRLVSWARGHKSTQEMLFGLKGKAQGELGGLARRRQRMKR